MVRPFVADRYLTQSLTSIYYSIYTYIIYIYKVYHGWFPGAEHEKALIGRAGEDSMQLWWQGFVHIWRSGTEDSREAKLSHWAALSESG